MEKKRMTFMQIFNMSFRGSSGFSSAWRCRTPTSAGSCSHSELMWPICRISGWPPPLTGMIVQPIIGHYSDRTWCRLGRRRPYFLAGAILASLMLFLMPNSPSLAGFLSPLLIGAGILMIMDASINVAMEPFRALVADKLPSEQRTLGFSMQTSLIGVGAVVGAVLPYVLTNGSECPTPPPKSEEWRLTCARPSISVPLSCCSACCGLSSALPNILLSRERKSRKTEVSWRYSRTSAVCPGLWYSLA